MDEVEDEALFCDSRSCIDRASSGAVRKLLVWARLERAACVIYCTLFSSQSQNSNSPFHHHHHHLFEH